MAKQPTSQGLAENRDQAVAPFSLEHLSECPIVFETQIVPWPVGSASLFEYLMCPSDCPLEPGDRKRKKCRFLLPRIPSCRRQEGARMVRAMSTMCTRQRACTGSREAGRGGCWGNWGIGLARLHTGSEGPRCTSRRENAFQRKGQ